jgi:hypothetical protein
MNKQCIDNSFSIHTSKRLTFFVALEERGPKPAPQPSEMSGWLLKKKRKRMQGKNYCMCRLINIFTMAFSHGWTFLTMKSYPKKNHCV